MLDVSSIRRALGRAALPAALAACSVQPLLSDSTSTSGGSTSGSTTGSTFCADACTANQRCDASVVLMYCASSCASSLGAELQHLRPDFVAAWTTCLNGATCTSWQVGTALQSCHDQAAATITPSAAAETYCTEAATKDTTCAGGGSQAICLDTARTYDDASLTAGTSCLAEDCTQYVACTKAAFGTQ